MVLRFLFRYLANNDQLVNRLADSKPIRRAAQMFVYFFTVGKEAAANRQLTAGRLRSLVQKFKAELEEAKHEMNKAKDEFKKDGFRK